MKQLIRSFMSNIRYKEAKKWIIGNSLDVGCEKYRDIFTKCCDKCSKEIDFKIDMEDAQELSYLNNSFDTVCCLETLEHTFNPVQAIKELKRVAKKRLIISVPKEPNFSIVRLCTWNKEHLWAVTPRALEHYLGRPIYKTTLCFRWYFAVWDTTW